MKKILFLVDNDRTIRLFYQEKLSLLGLEVMTSSDSEGLYETIDFHKPDVIFMDMKRWEDLKIYPAFQYNIECVTTGYVIGRAMGSNGLGIEVNVEDEKEFESLEMIISKGNKAGENHDRGLPNNLPPPTELQNNGWNSALTH